MSIYLRKNALPIFIEIIFVVSCFFVPQEYYIYSNLLFYLLLFGRGAGDRVCAGAHRALHAAHRPSEKPKRRENILETSNCNNGVFSDCFRIDYCLRELFPQFRHRNDYAEKGYTSAFDCFCNFYDVSSCNHRRIFLP